MVKLHLSKLSLSQRQIAHRVNCESFRTAFIRFIYLFVMFVY